MSDVGEAYDEVRAALGAEAASIMPYTAAITVPGAPVNAGDGTTTEGSPTEVPNVPCDYSPLSSYERIAAGALKAGADYALEFPFVLADGTPLVIPPDARVTIAVTAVLPAMSFDVVGPMSSQSIWKQRFSATLRG